MGLALKGLTLSRLVEKKISNSTTAKEVPLGTK